MCRVLVSWADFEDILTPLSEGIRNRCFFFVEGKLTVLTTVCKDIARPIQIAYAPASTSYSPLSHS